MSRKILHECPGCGCEIDSGLLWLPTPCNPWLAAELCCNKRCVSRAQRRFEALRTGAPLPRRPKQPALPPAEPIQPESSWGSLCRDVLAHLSGYLEARDLLAAALTCRHWRDQLTLGVTALQLRVDDVSSGRMARVAEVGDGSGLVRSAVCMLPRVHSLSLTVFSASRNPSLLLRNLHALTRWSTLRHVRVDWDLPPPVVEGASCGHSGPDSGGGGARSGGVGWESVLCPMGLGALGLLRGLESLSITANFDQRSGLGLFGLSSLERLTSLELLQAPSRRGVDLANFPWSARDADLAALTALISLRISGQLLSPALLGALTRLTHLAVEDLPLATYAGWYLEDGGECYRTDALAEELVKLRGLRLLEIDVGDRPAAPVEELTWGFRDLAEGLRKLTEAQIWDLQQQQEQQEQAAQPQPQPLLQPAPVPPAHPQPQPQPHPTGESRRRRRRQAAHGNAPANGNANGNPNPAPNAVINPSGAGGATGATTGLGAAGPLRVELRFSGLTPQPTAAAFGSGGGDDDDGGDGDGGGGGEAVPRVVLDDALLEDLSAVVGLSSLDLRFDFGRATSVHKLGQLTNLTHLGLRFGNKSRPVLEPRDLQILILGMPYLRTLVLELPASFLTPAALNPSLNLAMGLRELELHAMPQIRKVPYDRWQVRGRLLRVAERAAAAAASGSGTAAVSTDGVVDCVSKALQPLLFLQQLFMSMRLDRVRQALLNEAEWRQQHAAQQAAAAALAQQQQMRQLNIRLQQLLRSTQVRLQEEELQLAAARQQLQAQEDLAAAAAAAATQHPPEQLPGEQGAEAAAATAAAAAAVVEEEGATGSLIRSEQLQVQWLRVQEQLARQQQRQLLLQQLNQVGQQMGSVQPLVAPEAAQQLLGLYQQLLNLIEAYVDMGGVGMVPQEGEPHGGVQETVQGQGQGQQQQPGSEAQPDEAAAASSGGDLAAGANAPAPWAPYPAAAAAAAAAATAATAATFEAVANAVAAAAPGPPAADAAAAAAAVAADAGAMPSLEAWVVRADYGNIDDGAGGVAAADSPDQLHQQGQQPDTADPDTASASAAEWGMSASAASEGAAAPPGPPAVPLHELSLEQLRGLRSLLIREELVLGPVFKLSAWTPPRLEVLRLRGFAGLDFSRMWGGNRAGAGAAGAAAAAAVPLRLAAAMPCLRVLDVVTVGGECAAVIRREVNEWASPAAGRAPRLAEVKVAAATEMEAPAVLDEDDD